MYIYGKNVAIETLKNNKKINKAFISNNFNNQFIVNELNKKQIKIINMKKIELDKMVNGLHQGIVLDVPDYQYSKIEDLLTLEKPLVVILDHLEDPHNFGAIIRTCEAAGVDGIIIPSNRSIEVNGTVLKTSVGTAEKMRIIRVKNIANTIDNLKKAGFWIFGTDMNGTDYTELDYNGKIAIVCGNEGTGMSRLVRDKCDFIASIPMQGAVNSLNASVATAIVVFQAVKMRG